MKNKFLKILALIPVHLLALLYSWILSFFVTAGVIIAIGVIWSIFAALPAMILTKLWLLYFVATVPLTLTFFILIELKKGEH